MLNKERRKDVGRLGDLHPCGNVGLVAPRTVIEQYGWKGAGTSWFPEVCFEMQRSAWKLHCLGNYGLLGLAESRNGKKRKSTGRYWFFIVHPKREYTSKLAVGRRGY